MNIIEEDIHTLITSNLFRNLLGLKNFRFENSTLIDNTLYFKAKSITKYTLCPYCGKLSRSVHSTYTRHLQSLPIHNMSVKIVVVTRKFRCKNVRCTHSIFSERHIGLTTPYSRKTISATQILRNILVEIPSNKGAQISSLISLKQSSSTCLRIVKSIDTTIDRNKVKHICIDDFAYKKGISYGTILIDADTGRTLELIKGRDKDSVAPTLRKYPNVEIVSRDRSSAYSLAVCESLPKAKQVADRFHLIKNCGDHIRKQIKKSFSSIYKELFADYKLDECNVGNNATTLFFPLKGHISEKKKKIYEKIHALKNKSLSERSIASELGIDRKTIHKYLQHTECPGRNKAFLKNYEEYIPTIIACINDNLRITEIHRELKKDGFVCCYESLKNWIKQAFPEYNVYMGRYRKKTCQQIESENEMLISSKIISSAKIPIYVCNTQWGIDKKTGECSREHIMMEKAITNSKLLSLLREAYVSFKSLFSKGNKDLLDEWINKWENSEFTRLKTFANGMKNDLDAVKNSIIYHYSNGLAEGLNNKLKTLKRGMYGRAGNRLLEIKMIKSTTG